MYLGIDFGGTNLKIGIFGEDSSVLKFEESKLEDVFDKDKPQDSMVRFVKNFSEKTDLKKGGIAIKGLVDRNTGTLINDIGAANVFADINLREMFEQALGIPFTVENDARAYTYGEYKFGAGKNYDSIIALTLGTGVGCSAVINNNLYYSNDPLSGILGGHISIDRNGPECDCGNKGCLELYCSATALKKIIAKKHTELVGADDVLPKFFSLLNENNLYKETMNEFNENLAIGIVNLIHTYGPEAVIVGGGLVKSHKLFLPDVNKIVKKRTWTNPRGKIDVLPSLLGNKAAALGAAFMEYNFYGV